MGKKTRKKLNINEIIAYECHTKGLSMDKSSGVEHKGTFLGVIERLDYIKKLGVNQLIMMPVYDFEESFCEIYGAPEGVHLKGENRLRNYWGFTKGDYFHTKKIYGDENAFKLLVSEVHKRGMEIVTMMHFEYDVNTELMLDVLKYWAEEFDVDGFFINVNPYYLKMISDCSSLKAIKLYVYDIDGNLKYTNPERIAVYDYGFRNVLRRMLKGDEQAFEDYYNYLNSDSNFNRIISITSHNGFTLNDLYSYNRKHNEANGEYNRDGEDINYSENFGLEGNTDDETVLSNRLKAMENALFMLLLTKGIPMILSGDEAGNSQNGNNNAYCQDNEIGWVQYDGLFSERLSDVIKKVVEIRNSSEIFKANEDLNCNKVNKYSIPCISVHTGQAWECKLDYFTKSGGILYAGEDAFLYIAANFDKYDRKLSIPHLPKDFKWSMIAGTDVKNQLTIDDLDNIREIYLKSQSIMIFIGRK